MGEMTPDLGRDGQSGALNERKFDLECVDGLGHRPDPRTTGKRYQRLSGSVDADNPPNH